MFRESILDDKWSETTRRIYERLQGHIRVLLSDVRWVEWSEWEEVLLPLIQTHAGSSQNMNVAFVEKIDKVVLMCDEPGFVALVDKDGVIEVLRDG